MEASTGLENYTPSTPNSRSIVKGYYLLKHGDCSVRYSLNNEEFIICRVSKPSYISVADDDDALSLEMSKDSQISLVNSSCADCYPLIDVSHLIHKLKSVSHMMHHLMTAVSPEFIQALLEQGEFQSLSAGEVFFKQGAPSDCVCFLLNGKLEAFLGEGDGITVVGEIGRGEVFGEMGVLSHSPRTTSIRASRNSEVLTISDVKFEQLRKRFERLNDFITTTLIQRLNTQNQKVKAQHKPLTRVVLPISHKSDLSWLKSALGQQSKVIECDLILEKFDSQQLNQIHATSLYSELERAEQLNKYCHYWCDTENSEWLFLSLSRADEIWIVTDAEEVDEQLSAMMERLNSDPRWDALDKTIVRAHTSLQQISGTANFLDEVHSSQCYHYQIDDVSSQQRIVRYMLNQANGLVLGGGGARGLAHIGLYQALLEMETHIDAVGGTSIGSVMAACIALDWTLDEINQHVNDNFVEINPLGDYTFPFVAISKSRRLNKALKGVFGDKQIEDMPLPFYCVSSNISDASEKVHRRGTLWKAVRASLAIPGVISPAIDRGHFYVDGGLINNLPTNIMSEIKIAKLIAHDVSDNPVLESEISRIPGGWRYLWQKVRRKPVKVPSILEILFRSTLLAGVKRTNENISFADVYLKPDLTEYGMLEFAKADEIKQVGYRYAMASFENNPNT